MGSRIRRPDPNRRIDMVTAETATHSAKLSASLGRSISCRGTSTRSCSPNARSANHGCNHLSSTSAGFAILATVLAAVGPYGVLAYTVAQRTQEFGLRMALGANGGRVRAMVLRQVGVITFIGSIIGIVAAVGVARAAESILFGMKGSIPSHDGLEVRIADVHLPRINDQRRGFLQPNLRAQTRIRGRAIETPPESLLLRCSRYTSVTR